MRRIALSLIAALLLGACAGGTDETATPQVQETLTVTEELGQKPTVEVPAEDPPSELRIIDVVEGDGDEAVDGSTVLVHYVGVNWSNGLQFDASWDRGQPFDFELGRGMVIQGWDEGVLGMKVGGRRRLEIPPDMAYGEAGAGGVIGPNETLVFVVDLLAVS